MTNLVLVVIIKVEIEWSMSIIRLRKERTVDVGTRRLQVIQPLELVTLSQDMSISHEVRLGKLSIGPALSA